MDDSDIAAVAAPRTITIERFHSRMVLTASLILMDSTLPSVHGCDQDNAEDIHNTHGETIRPWIWKDIDQDTVRLFVLRGNDCGGLDSVDQNALLPGNEGVARAVGIRVLLGDRNGDDRSRDNDGDDGDHRNGHDSSSVP